MSKYDRPNYREVARQLIEKVVGALYLDSSNTVSFALYPPASQASSSNGNKTYAGALKTPKNLGAAQLAAKLAKALSLISLVGNLSRGRASLTNSSGSAGSLAPLNKRDDYRLLVIYHTTINRLEPFALRQELCSRIE